MSSYKKCITGLVTHIIQTKKMIRYESIMIGDWVLVDGTPRQIQAITKKKIGYHRKENEPRLYYARLRDVEPIEIKSMSFKDANEGFVINDTIYLCCDIRDLRIEAHNSGLSLLFVNILGESLFLHANKVHSFQHLLSSLGVKVESYLMKY